MAKKPKGPVAWRPVVDAIHEYINSYDDDEPEAMEPEFLAWFITTLGAERDVALQRLAELEGDDHDI